MSPDGIHPHDGPDGEATLRMFAEACELIPEVSTGIDRLRAFILDVAIRGRLVPQHAAEALPAWAHAASQTSTVPFAIPESWRCLQLDAVADLTIGKTPATRESRFWSGDESGIAWVSIGDMRHYGSVSTTGRRVSTAAAAEVFRDRVVPAGTLIMSFKLTIGKIALLGCDAFHNEAIVSIVPRDEGTKRFLFWVLPRLALLGASNAAVMGSTLNRESLGALPIPLPPLAEQKRIVAKVDQLMALCDELEARQTKKRDTSTRLTKSALQALTTAEGPDEFDLAWKRVVENFDVLIDRAEKVGELRKAIIELAVRGAFEPDRRGEETVEALLERIDTERRRSERKFPSPGPVDPAEAPFDSPAGWRWVRWGQLVLTSDAGWSPQCENHPRTGDQWGVVKVSAVSWDRFLPEENKALPSGVAPRPECAVRNGDFLMSRANTAELVGRSVVVGTAPAHLMMSDKIVRCTFSTLIEPRFINLYNKTNAARAHYTVNASGTSDSMKNISREVIFAMPIPLPPVAEQRRIVDRVEQLMRVCDDLEARLTQAEGQAAGLAQAVVRDLVK